MNRSEGVGQKAADWRFGHDKSVIQVGVVESRLVPILTDGVLLGGGGEGNGREGTQHN